MKKIIHMQFKLIFLALNQAYLLSKADVSKL